MAKNTESTVVPTQTQDVAEVAVDVLSRYRIEKVGKNDAHIYERIKLSEKYKDEKGVKEFTASNGEITYYAEKLVKKYSDNVVTE